MSGWQVSASGVVCVVCFVITTTRGDVTRDQAARIGVDIVLTRGGGELRGSIVSREEGGSLVIAVRRNWLRDEQLQRLAAEEQAEAERRLETYEQLVDRIRDWLRDCEDEPEFAAILERELEEYEAYVEDPDSLPLMEPSEFLLIEIDADNVRRVLAQPAQRKQAALVAWQEGLPDVETTSFVELQEMLVARDVDWRNTRVDLSDRLPTGMPQSESEWAARKAVYEFAFRERIEFQGTGDMVFRTDPDGDGEQPGMDQLLGNLLGGGLNVDLEQLLGGNGLGGVDDRPGWRETAIESAKEDGGSGFRVTRVETDLQNSRVVVETVFLAQVDDDTWETIWRYRETLDASEERNGLADRIRQDPQLAEPFKLLESLGLNEQLGQAVQFGAATMDAQQTADDRFFEFFGRYTERLDGPPLRWEGMGAR